jgi:hypothetical protein
VLHIDMFAHNKNGIVYRDKSRRPETAVDHKSEPHHIGDLWDVHYLASQNKCVSHGRMTDLARSTWAGIIPRTYSSRSMVHGVATKNTQAAIPYIRLRQSRNAVVAWHQT